MLEGTITNTFAGSRRGSKWVYTLDEDGTRIQTNSLKVTISESEEFSFNPDVNLLNSGEYQ